MEVDLRTRDVTWTPAMYEIFGRDPATPPPRREDAVKLFHPEDRARYRAVIVASDQGEASPPAEFRVLRPDGGIRWVYHESEVVRDDAGRPWLRVGTFRDVTEIHDYQERQKSLQSELLARERLSAIGSVTERLARELRDPLSTITCSLFSLQSDPGQHASSADRALKRIERSTGRCNQIIGDLLEYSHGGPLRRRTHDIDDWLREAVTGLAFDATVTLEFDLRAPGVVDIDPVRLRRALSSLVENAAQAAAETGDAGGAPLVRLRSRVRAGQAEIAIIDNGPGIAEQTLERAFEPLFSTKRFGTGLGLTTARQIVEEHGGTIELTSKFDDGTRAIIRLPLAAVAERGSDMPSAA
jgi:PAS domain S-box-containing protein